jgi:hypothetical protein
MRRGVHKSSVNEAAALDHAKAADLLAALHRAIKDDRVEPDEVPDLCAWIFEQAQRRPPRDAQRSRTRRARAGDVRARRTTATDDPVQRRT